MTLGCTKSVACLELHELQANNLQEKAACHKVMKKGFLLPLMPQKLFLLLHAVRQNC